MVLRYLFLVCVISVPLFSLSQESGKAKLRTPVTKPRGEVSKAGIIYVVGDVHKPIGVVMNKIGSVTVLTALAAAEGTNPTAGLYSGKILRKGEYGRTEIPLDIKKILQAKAADVTLQADDILFIPHGTGNSTGKQQREDLYDVPPSDPLQDLTPIYPR
jgi:hypothetical protein